MSGHSINGVIHIDDLMDGVLLFHSKGMDCGLRMGWSVLDEHYRVRRGDLVIVTGIPSSGKSELLDDFMVRLAGLYDWRFCVYSPENYPPARHYVKLLEKYLRKPFMPGYREHITLQDIVSSKDWMQEHFTFLSPAEDDVNLQGIYKIVEHCQTIQEYHGLVLDPWNEISTARKEGKTETEFVAEALGFMRRRAREWNMTTWLVAHPTKLQKQANGSYPVPTPYDISGSAHFRNKADHCLTVHRHDLNSEICEVHIQKIKQKELGKCGMVQLRYDKATGCFGDY